jgi:hypothetical protein
MKLDRHICDNHASKAASHEELFTSVPDAIGTYIEFLHGTLMVDGVPLDLCQECFETVPLKTILDSMHAAAERARA